MANVSLAQGLDAPYKIAAASPKLILGDPMANADIIISTIRHANKLGVDYLSLPELCLSGATLSSLLHHPLILRDSKAALDKICLNTRQCSLTCSIGLPYMVAGSLASCMAIIKSGRVHAIIPSPTYPSPYGFSPDTNKVHSGKPLTPISKLAVGFAGDLFSKTPSSVREGYVMLMASSLNATAKSAHEIETALKSYSARTGMAIAYASPNINESSSSFVFDGMCAIACQGKVITSKPFDPSPFITMDIFPNELSSFEPYEDEIDSGLYLSSNPALEALQLERILDLQSLALIRRAEHIGVKGFLVGVSGGLDSALALLACAKAADRMGMDRKNIMGVSMPGFGSSSRTKSNAELLITSLGCTYKQIDITPACRQHFADIEHDESNHNVVFENAQARERTQILLSLANAHSLLDVGTGDLSESALGWTTFGGDHLAQYGINASIPKTVMRKVVAKAAEYFTEAKDVLQSILDTPVSPELLPLENDNIIQKTEEVLGSYELHDFFIYHTVNGATPKEIFEKACEELDFPKEEIYRVLGIFLRRFFAQQFKRSCAPESPNIVFSIAPSSFLMPSDMKNSAWMREYEEIKI